MGRATLPAPLVTPVDAGASPDSGVQRPEAAEPARRHRCPWPAPVAEPPVPGTDLGTADGPPSETGPHRSALAVIRRARLAAPAATPEEIVNRPAVRVPATPAHGGSR
ncbi:hypothetical protein ACIQVT_01145 [Streptomyces sp. NPDC100445]|uniref:hypothetical protein n=1 Tax=Streptomyces sp. NPDC100445 TaxID=3366102 RepID=UPI003829D527